METQEASEGLSFKLARPHFHLILLPKQVIAEPKLRGGEINLDPVEETAKCKV